MKTRYSIPWIAVLAWAPVGALWILPLVATAQETSLNPLGMVLAREHGGEYTGGTNTQVIVRIGASSWEGITAMGLYEKIPEGWTLEDVRLLGGVPPSVAPERGAAGVLQFIWIVPPRAPVALLYTLRVPARDSGIRPFSGQIEYRLGGGKLTSNVALSQVDGVADEIPVVTLRGAAALTVRQYAAFEDPGATAKDKEDGDLSSRVQVAGRVDTDKPGAYTLTYGVMDRAGNRAEPVSRTVTVARGSDAGDKRDPAPAGGKPGPSVPHRRVPDVPLRTADADPVPTTSHVLPGSEIPGLDQGGPPFSLRPPNGGVGAGTDTPETGVDAPLVSQSAMRQHPQGASDIDAASAALARDSTPLPGGPGDDSAPFAYETESGQALALAAVVVLLILVAAGWWTAARSGRRRAR